MSYQVLARKWRPQKFSELVGQEHVVKAISNALDNDKLHHAYLFTGTRGVGKTTIARIFSKSLNCETGQSSTPCGSCNACLDIDQGRYVDLLEIDAASRTKVEDTRELLDNVQYKPTRGRFKVYLIDEVHMLSKHSFNALLKTLEEPPPHVKFLLATTDPQKLPVTILSRCLQFSLKALSREQIQAQLTHVLAKEDIPSSETAISHLSRAAQGSMRDALSLTDQAIAQGNNAVDEQTVIDMLGLLDKNQVLKLVKAIIEKDATAAMQQLEDICMHAPDYAQVIAELLALFHQICLTQVVPEVCKVETLNAKVIYQLSKAVTPEHIQLLYQITLQGKKDLPYAPDALTGLQMTLMRLLAFSPATPVEIDIVEQHDTQNSERVAAPTSDLSSSGVPPTGKSEADDQQQPQQVVAATAVDTAPSFDEQMMEMNLEQDENVLSDMFSEMHNVASQASQQVAQASNLLPPSPNNVDVSEQKQTTAVEDLESLFALKDELEVSVNTSVSIDKKPAASVLDRFLTSVDDKPIASEEEQNPQTIPAQASSLHKEVSEAADSTPQQPSITEQPAIHSPDPEDDLPPFELDVVDTYDKQTQQVIDINDLPQDNIQATVAHQQSPLESDEIAQQPATADVIDYVPRIPDIEPTAADISISAYLNSGDKLTLASQIDNWSKMIQELSALNVKGLNKQLLMKSNLISTGDKVIVRLCETEQHLDEPESRQSIAQAMSQYFQQEVVFELQVGEVKSTPEQIQKAIDDMRRRHAKDVVANDEMIQEIITAFEGKVVENSISPLPEIR